MFITILIRSQLVEFGEKTVRDVIRVWNDKKNRWSYHDMNGVHVGKLITILSIANFEVAEHFLGLEH